MPDASRWRCTFKLSYRLPKLKGRSLDDILAALGMEPRAEGEPHDAINDATLCGQAYMKLMELQNPDET